MQLAFHFQSIQTENGGGDESYSLGHICLLRAPCSIRCLARFLVQQLRVSWNLRQSMLSKFTGRRLGTIILSVLEEEAATLLKRERKITFR